MVKKTDIVSIGTITGFYLLMEMAGITCPILFLTGVSCAGCGMSRAWLSVCRADWRGAFCYHPLFWLPIPAVLLLLNKKNMPRRWFVFMGIAIIALFLAVWAVRMMSPGDEIVVFCPERGILYRIGMKILALAGHWA